MEKEFQRWTARRKVELLELIKGEGSSWTCAASTNRRLERLTVGQNVSGFEPSLSASARVPGFALRASPRTSRAATDVAVVCRAWRLCAPRACRSVERSVHAAP